MKYWLLSLLFFSTLVCCQETSETESEPSQSRKTVFILPLRTQIDKGLMAVFRRAFKEAERTNPDAIIIDMDTPGGELFITKEIIAWLRNMRQKNITVYSYVNPDAISAGAIISFGCNEVFMSPGGSIGSATPVMMGPDGPVVPEGDYKEKIFSFTRTMMRTLAQENGHNPDIAEAMVDKEKEVKIGDEVICEKGTLLNLSSEEAIRIIPPMKKPLLASAIVNDINEILELRGLKGAELVRFEESSADKAARFLVTIGPLLLMIGLACLYLEAKAPGFGVFGFSGLGLLALFFFGHYIAGLAGYEEIALVVIGVVLVALEIFVIPGFGVAGISGISCIFIGIALAVVPQIPTENPLPGIDLFSWDDYMTTIFIHICTMIGGTFFLIWILSKILPKTPFYSSLVLQTALNSDVSTPQKEKSEYDKKELIGKKGSSLTVLRPCGTAEIEGHRLDVVSSGEMITKGDAIKVITVEGNRIVVEKSEEID